MLNALVAEPVMANLRNKTCVVKKSLPLILTCGVLMAAGCSTAHHVTKWEYRMVKSLKDVNELADEGWTVVDFAIPGQGGPNEYLLKRAKP